MNDNINFSTVNHTSLEMCTPESVGITSASLLNVIETAKARGIQLHSLMVLRHGKVAAQLWWKPYAPDIPHHLYSFSKSLTATAIGFALDEGLLSLDDRIIKFFPRRVGENADSRIYSVTVEHLLTMTSGIVLSNEATMFVAPDWVEQILNSPLTYFPGDRFVYNSLNTYLLSAILRRVAGVGLVDYLTPRLFQPLGIPIPHWDKCPMGIECGGWGLSLRTEDMARFCQLYLDDGIWQGKRILPEGWAAAAGSHHVDTDSDSKFRDTPHNRSGYGYQFWVNRDRSSFRADGMMGQYGIVMKEKDMVVVTTACCSDQLLVLDLLWDVFFPFVDIIPHDSQPGSDYDDLCAIAQTLEMPVPTSVPRCRDIEDRISGNVYSFPLNRHSLLPLALRYLYDVPPLGIDELCFEFTDDVCYISWREDGTYNRLPFRLDGHYEHGKVLYSGNERDVVTYAAWTSLDTLEIYIRIIRTPHMLKARFRFPDDTVVYSYNEDPTFEEYARTILDLIKAVRLVSPHLAKLADKITPSVTGTLRKSGDE